MINFLNNGGIEMLLVILVGIGAIARNKMKERKKNRYVTLNLNR